MNPTTEPALSVVVLPLDGGASLTACLTAITAQAAAAQAEILVPHDDALADVAALVARFPAVRFLAAPGRRTCAELRAFAVRHSRAPVVALTEDHCVPEPDWCANIVQAHAAPQAAIGGPVEKGPDRILPWAVYLADYVRYAAPQADGPARSLTDCNVSYKRAALDAVTDLWRQELHENVVNGALQARGEVLWLSPRVAVRQQRRTLTLGGSLNERYTYGRLFGSTRVAGAGAKRWLYAAACWLLPAVQVARVAGHVARRPRLLGQFCRALPALLLLAVAWSWGEFLGYLTGRAERSLTPAAQPAEIT